MKPIIVMFSLQPDRLRGTAEALLAELQDIEVNRLEFGAVSQQLTELKAADLVVLDAEGLSDGGAEWCRRLKGLVAGPILLRAQHPLDDAEGFVKPTADPLEMLAQVRILLRLKRREEEVRRQEQKLQQELEKRVLALRETEHRFRVIFENSPDAVFVESDQGLVLDVNPAACRLHGLSKDRLVGIHVTELVPPSQREAVVRDFPLWFSGALQLHEGYSYTADGRIIPVEMKASRIEYRDQPALLLLVRDISERRSGEDRRTATVQGLRAIVDIADDLIACPDMDALHRQAVELARSRLGLERAAIFLSDGRNVFGTFGTTMDGETSDERSHRVTMDEVWRERFRLRGLNEPRWSLSLEPLRNWHEGTMQPHAQGWVAVTPIQTASKSMGVFFNDSAISRTTFDPVRQEIVAVYCSLLANIMERKSAESDRSRLAVAVEQSAEAVLISDLNGTISYVNPAFERITGFRASEVLGLNPRILKSGRHDVAFYERMWARLRAGEAWTGRITNRRKDGMLYEAEQTTSPIRDSKGTVVGYLTVSQDVTRSIQMENELRQAQKMDSIGRLAGGIAHDFNNLLTGILGFAKVIMEDLGPAHPSRPDLEEIMRAGERAAKLTRQLLAFGHKQVLQIQPLDINAVVVRLDSMLRRTLGENIELVTEATESVSSVEADAGLIEQVIMNLALNARDAMPQGGKMMIRAADVAVHDPELLLHPEAKAGTYVMLSVSDNGSGMTEVVKQQAFEPFFTTKEKGRGLGLSTVYGIVRQFGGFVELDSAPGLGTEVRLYFPACTEAPRPAQITEEKPSAQGGETILVVEDEGTVRRLALRILKGLGYHTLEARNGDEGLSVYEQHAGVIDLVLTDVIMPRMGGPEMVARLREKKADVKILYMSGYTDDARLDGLQAEKAASLILKPFTRDSMATEIRRVLSGG